MFIYVDCEADMSLIRNQTIEELGFKLGTEVEDLRIKYGDDPPIKKPKTESRLVLIDIVSLLANNLTPESQRLLKTLVLTSPQGRGFPFASGWVQPMARLLPSLTTLKLDSRMIKNDEFASICENFPRLLVLDISRTKTTSLKGISNIMYLGELSIGSWYLEDIDEMYELKALKNLRMRDGLNDSEMLDSLKSFINSDKSLVALKLFDCADSNINIESLKKIEARHPTLAEIIVTGNSFVGYFPNNPNIRVISDDTFPACFNALEYFEKTAYYNGIIYTLQTISDKIDEPFEDLEKRWLQHLVRILYRMIPKHEGDVVIYLEIVNCCWDLATKQVLELLDNEDKRVLIECFLRIIESSEIEEVRYVSQLWNDMNEVIKETLNPQTNRLISAALKYFLLTDDVDIKCPCLETIECLLDKMNLQSDFYKKLDQEKLLTKLKNDLSDFDSFPNSKELIEKLIKIFETNQQQL
ncbi:unnamed protein product [Caenorhabditis brenneri]